jgi:hypothetical protein
MSRIISVLKHNYGEESTVLIKEIYKIGLQLYINEQLKITYLNIMFKKLGFKVHPVENKVRSQVEYDILKSINICLSKSEIISHNCEAQEHDSLFNFIMGDVKILDIGCGPGNFLGEIGKRKEDLFGLDVV